MRKLNLSRWVIGLSVLAVLSMDAPHSFAVAAKAEESVWVTRPDGSESCETGADTAESLEKGRRILRQAKIKVLAAKKGDDGKFHVQVCGAPTGGLSEYLIPKKQLEKALILGFQKK